jgi:hypothetical protein
MEFFYWVFIRYVGTVLKVRHMYCLPVAKWTIELMFMCKLYMRVDHVELPQLSMSLLSNNPARYAAFLDSNSVFQTCYSRVKLVLLFPILISNVLVCT